MLLRSVDDLPSNCGKLVAAATKLEGAAGFPNRLGRFLIFPFSESFIFGEEGEPGCSWPPISQSAAVVPPQREAGGDNFYPPPPTTTAVFPYGKGKIQGEINSFCLLPRTYPALRTGRRF